MDHVDLATLAFPVEGVRLDGPLLGDQFKRRTLLVFLRHFGCLFCREMVKDLRRASETIASFPQVLYVYQGSVEDGEWFFGRFSPESTAIADTPKKLYEAFGLQPGKKGQMFGPMVWPCAIRAVTKGNLGGKPVGDVWMMPGMFLIQPDGAITWQHRFAHIGDHPDLRSIPTETAPLIAQPA